MSKDQYWNRHCKTKGCHGLAKPLSDYCKPCHKKRLEKFEEVTKDAD